MMNTGRNEALQEISYVPTLWGGEKTKCNGYKRNIPDRANEEKYLRTSVVVLSYGVFPIADVYTVLPVHVLNTYIYLYNN